MIPEYEHRWFEVGLTSSTDIAAGVTFPLGDSHLLINVNTASATMTMSLPKVTDPLRGMPIVFRKTSASNTLHLDAETNNAGALINGSAGLSLTGLADYAYCIPLASGNWGALT